MRLLKRTCGRSVCLWVTRPSLQCCVLCCAVQDENGSKRLDRSHLPRPPIKVQSWGDEHEKYSPTYTL